MKLTIQLNYLSKIGVIQPDQTLIVEEADIHITAHFSQAIKEKSNNIALL